MLKINLSVEEIDVAILKYTKLLDKALKDFDNIPNGTFEELQCVLELGGYKARIDILRQLKKSKNKGALL